MILQCTFLRVAWAWCATASCRRLFVGHHPGPRNEVEKQMKNVARRLGVVIAATLLSVGVAGMAPASADTHWITDVSQPDDTHW